MIAVWMIYSIATAALVVAAGLAVERLCLSLRRPTRWVWAAVLAFSFIVSANNWRLLQRRATSDPGSWTTVIGGTGSSSVVVADRLSVARQTDTRRGTAVDFRLDVEQTIAVVRRSLAFDPSRFDYLGTPLLVGWFATSIAALLYLGAAIVGMRRLIRDMPAGVMDGHHVFISSDIGPALIGVMRARIVLPRWAADLCEAERRYVLAHESEHAAAGDPLLLVAGVALVAIHVWNLPLWFAVSRLRFSIEADCDARVLGRAGDARSYGRLLVRVHTRSAPILAARLAFTGTTSRLESRIRRLLGTGRPRKLVSALLAASCVGIVTAAACIAPTPVRSLRQSVVGVARPVTRAPRVAPSDTVGRAVIEPMRTVSNLAAMPSVARPDTAVPPSLEVLPPASNLEATVGQPSQGLGCGRQTEGFFGPTFNALRNAARARYAALFDQVQTTATVIAFAIDGTRCTIERDTVLTIPLSGSYSANVLYSRAFPDLPERSPEIGLGDAREREVPPIRGNPPLMILYALTNLPRERASCDGVSTNIACSITGEVVVRVMDSVRVLVATENHLFMFTSAERLTTIASATIQRGHVEYADGALSVLSLSGRMPMTVFSVRNGKTPRIGERAERRFDAGLGLSHYAPTPVPLDAIGRLKVAPCSDSDAPLGSCFEVDGKLIRFPR